MRGDQSATEASFSGRLSILSAACLVLILPTCGGNTGGDSRRQGPAPGASSSVDAAASPDAPNPALDGDLTCAASAECELVPESCCECARSPVVALNAQAAARRLAECTSEGCAPCPGVGRVPFVANCSVIATCGLVRLEYVPGASDCTKDADCHVRTRSCCECGGSTAPGDLFGVSNDAAFRALVCSGSEACPECAPAYPPEVGTLCSDGFCLITDPRPL